MTPTEILSIAAPVFAGLMVLLTVFVTNHFDDRKAEAERLAKLSLRNEKGGTSASAAE